MRLRLPATVVFGNGALGELPRLAGELGVTRALVATDAGVAATGLPEQVVAQLAGAGLAARAWDGIVSDPDEAQAELCREHAAGCDGIVALGGGSVIDAAKVAAVLVTNGGRVGDYFGFDRVSRRGLPLVAVPTTPGSGAEVSSHAVILRRAPRRKEAVAGLHLLPSAALIDPRLAATLPPRPTLWSALDSLFHALEAFLARRATPLTDAFACLAVPEIAAALPRVLAADPDDEAREALGRGCLYASFAMANANAGAIHALGYPLSGRYGVPHGLANALMAVPTLERTWHGQPERSRELARLLGGGEAADLPERLRHLIAAVGVEDSLADWGVLERDLPGLARDASHFRPVLENAPLALGERDLLQIYRAALAAGAAARAAK